MRTKFTIIGESSSYNTTKTQFVSCLCSSNTKSDFTEAGLQPNDYQNVELVARNWRGDMDLMFAFDDSRRGGILYLGYWNEGC